MKLGAFFVEILPLLAFFVGYQYFGLISAAALSVGLEWWLWRWPGFANAGWRHFRCSRWPCRRLHGGGLGSGDGIFIKIQPTIFNGLFSLVLLGGLMTGRAMMRLFFEGQFRDRRYMAAAQLSLGMFLPAAGGGE